MDFSPFAEEPPELPHLQALSETCSQLRTLATKVMEIKANSEEGSHDLASALPLYVNKSTHFFVNLKTLNRQTFHHTRATKQKATEAKLHMDKENLALQNMNYERRHLEKEIQKCEEFDSIYQDVPLVNEDEFLRTGTTDLITSNDPHQRMLNRLKFEVSERLRLVQQLKELSLKRQQLQDEYNGSLADLEKLDRPLEEFLKNSQSLKEIIRMKLDTEPTRRQNDLAKLLPMPLFVLYKHAFGYSEAFDKSVVVEIEGDISTAAALLQTNARVQSFAQTSTSTSTSTPPPSSLDIPMQGLTLSSTPGTPSKREAEDDDLGPSKKKHKIDPDSGKQVSLFQKHPLVVIITINKDDTLQANAIIKITFTYLVQLGIICASISDITGVTRLDIRSMLTNLFPGELDAGMESPDPKHQFLMEGSEPFEFDPAKAGGHAYNWAQSLCGLDFASFPAQQTDVVRKWVREDSAGNIVVVRPYLAKVIELVRNRRSAWKALEKQLDNFQSLSFPQLKEEYLVSNSTWNPPKILEWKQLEPEYSGPQQSTAFKAIFQFQDNTKFEAGVTIPFAYPDRPPRYVLNCTESAKIGIMLKDRKLTDATATDDLSDDQSPLGAHLRAIEKEMNDSELSIALLTKLSDTERHLLLSYQVVKLTRCLGIFLEAIRQQNWQTLDSLVETYSSAIE